MCVPKLRFKADDGSEFPEWEERRLGDVCDIVGGGTPDTEKSEYWNEDINWFTPSEIGTTKYAVKSSRQISKLGILKSSAKLLPRGTILLTSRATLGEMAITRQECCTNQGFQSLIIKPGYLNEFIYYCQSVIKKYCKKHASGSTFLEIGKKEISECKLGIPSLPEQRKIAAFLSAIDTHLELLKSELSKWEQFKKGMLQKIFHQEVRFKAYDGSMYPEWVEKRLGEIGKLLNGYGFDSKSYCKSGKYRIVTIKNIQGSKYITLSDTDDFIMELPYNLKEYQILKERDILISMTGNIGRVSYNKGVLNLLNQRVGLLRVHDGVCKSYVYEILSSSKFKSQMEYLAEGAAQLNISKAMVESFVLSLPSLPEQQKIADLFLSIDQMIELSRQEVEYWKKKKKGLLQQMFV